jgi:hypothetical protein
MSGVDSDDIDITSVIDKSRRLQIFARRNTLENGIEVVYVVSFAIDGEVSDITAVYNSLVSDLSSAVNDGSFATSLIAAAQESGSDVFDNVDVEDIEISEVELVSVRTPTPTAKPTKAPREGGGGRDRVLSTGAIIGIAVVGAIVAAAIVGALLFFSSSRGPSAVYIDSPTYGQVPGEADKYSLHPSAEEDSTPVGEAHV